MVVNALEEAFHLLGVEALIDGLSVRAVRSDDSECKDWYWVRFRMRVMNLCGTVSVFSCSI